MGRKETSHSPTIGEANVLSRLRRGARSAGPFGGDALREPENGVEGGVADHARRRAEVRFKEKLGEKKILEHEKGGIVSSGRAGRRRAFGELEGIWTVEKRDIREVVKKKSKNT